MRSVCPHEVLLVAIYGDERYFQLCLHWMGVGSDYFIRTFLLFHHATITTSSAGMKEGYYLDYETVILEERGSIFLFLPFLIQVNNKRSVNPCLAYQGKLLPPLLIDTDHHALHHAPFTM